MAINSRVQSRVPSMDAIKNLSSTRKEALYQEIERGDFGKVGQDKKDDKHALTSLGLVSGQASTRKIATNSNVPGASWSGSGDVLRQGPELYSPLWLTSNTHLPRDRMTMNAWCRAFFALNPIVNNALHLHSTYPISKLNITCADKKIENLFNDMAEEMDLHNVCTQIAQEFFVIGEAFPYLEIDESTMKWKRCVIQNPDYVYVKRTAVTMEPEISLKPDAELRRIITNNDPQSVRLRRELPEDIIKYVRAGKNIPLDNFYISHLARKISPYEVRGTSLIASCFKALMLWDKLRECKYAQADGMINPITLVKLGGSADAEYRPSEGDLQAWRELMSQAQYDKDFKIITHGSVTIERIGATSVIDVSNDLTQLIKEIYIGLMVPQVIMEAGDITYANGSLSLDVLRQRYMQFQNMLSKWLRFKVFAPIAQLHDFYEYRDGEKRLVIPNVEWNHMAMFDLNDYIQLISQLVGERKIVSVHTLYRSLGLDYEDEQKRIKKESIVEAIHKKEQENLDRMSLTELKAIGDDDEIPDLPEIPVPGESPDEEPVGGEEAPSGGLPAPPTMPEAK